MRRSMAALVAGTAVLAAAVPARAVTTVTSVNGLNWQIHDIAPPKLDTGSIRAITDNAFYGFGGIRVRVSGIPATDTTARFNGELMRGFNLTYDGDESFSTAQPVVLGGVALSRAVKVSKAGNYTRWLDTFANTSQRTITVDVAFGGTAGQNSGTNQSKVVDSSSGDTLIGADDKWVEVANPTAAGVSARGRRRSSTAPRTGRATSSATRSATRCRSPGWRPTSTATRTRSRSRRARPGRCCATSWPGAPRRPRPRASRSRRSRPAPRRSRRRPTSPASPPGSAAPWSTGRRCSTPPPARPPRRRPSLPSSPPSWRSPPRAIRGRHGQLGGLLRREEPGRGVAAQVVASNSGAQLAIVQPRDGVDAGDVGRRWPGSRRRS